MAVVLILERTDESDLEEFTCTDLEQRWGQLKEETMSQFDAGFLKDFCHVTAFQSAYRRSVKEITEPMASEFRSLFIEDMPVSEAALLTSKSRCKPPASKEVTDDQVEILRGIIAETLSNSNYIMKRTQELGDTLYSKCSELEKEYYNKFVRVIPEESINICLRTVGQSNKEWEESRHRRITGSICYSLYTYSRNKNPKWPSKLEKTLCSDFEGNVNTERGLIYESGAKVWYERQKERSTILSAGIIINPMLPWLEYSADGLICVDKKLTKLSECKTPAAGKKNTPETICESLKYMEGGKLKQRHSYFGQVQLGLTLTSLEMCDFTLYCFGCDKICVDHITWNEKFCIEMLEVLANVYFKEVLPWLCKREK